MSESLYEQVDRYVADLLGPEDEALLRANETLIAAGMPAHSISANQGKLLQIFAGACQASRILEIGTLGGYSTIWLARALHGSSDRVVTIEANPDYADIARQNFAFAGLSDRIEVQVGAALDVLPELHSEIASEQARPFDFVFIDADKPPYVEYFEWALRMTRPGSIVIADNVIREGEVLNSSSSDAKVRGVQRLNAWLPTRSEITTTILPLIGTKGYDGMAIAVMNAPGAAP